MEGDYQDIYESDKEYFGYHSETDYEASYTDIETYNEASGEGIETVDEAQPEDMNEEVYDSDSHDKKQEKILVLNTEQMPNIEQLQGPKQKYGLGMGYAKKALDLAIWINKIEEFVSHLKNFIEEAKDDLFSTQNNAEHILVGDPLHVPHKGRQPNRYKSGAPANEDGKEMQHKNQNRTEVLSNNQVSALQDSEKK
ncbi:44200_t:CDS:2, partial [Gigaspora margarita]